MAHAHPISLRPADTARLGSRAWPVFAGAMLAGVVALAAAIAVALLSEHGLRRFAFAYLIAFGFWLSLALGCLFFVVVTHLFHAGWCAVVRRPFEAVAASLPVMAVLAVPLLVFVWADNGTLYPWADAEVRAAAAALAHHDVEGADAKPDPDHDHAAHADTAPGAYADHGDDHARAQADGDHGDHGDHGGKGVATGQPDHHTLLVFVGKKLPWVTPWFFTIRVVIYFALWSLFGWLYWKWSTTQDQTKDPALTLKMQWWAPVATIAFAFTITYGAFDLIMSIDPVWYSTIFGVYYFAGAFLGAVAAIILTLMGLKKLGYLPSVTVEHFHDLGKLLFAFVFFWGYIAFSQYMLVWYAAIPAETYWFQLRGMTTDPDALQYGGGWAVLAVILLFGHLLLPFAYLLSRHVKRNTTALAAACWWLLAMHLLDLVWLIRPALSGDRVWFGGVDVAVLALCMVGVGGVLIGQVVRRAANHPLTAQGDPRLQESLGFKNI